MNYNYEQSFFSRTILTSVLVGFAATILCLGYNIFYRDSTGYQPSDFINVSSLIFAVNLIFFLIGLLYFFFLRTLKKPDLIFTVLFVLLTVFCMWRASQATMENNTLLSSEFRTLLMGIIAIMGIGASFFVPYLFRHKNLTDHIL